MEMELRFDAQPGVHATGTAVGSLEAPNFVVPVEAKSPLPSRQCGRFPAIIEADEADVTAQNAEVRKKLDVVLCFSRFGRAMKNDEITVSPNVMDVAAKRPLKHIRFNSGRDFCQASGKALDNLFILFVDQAPRAMCP